MILVLTTVRLALMAKSSTRGRPWPWVSWPGSSSESLGSSGGLFLSLRLELGPLLVSPDWLPAPEALPPPLPDSLALPSADYTQQRPVCTRQTLCRVLHSANATRQSLPRQRDLCRVSDFGHSAKTLPRALALGKAAMWRHPGPALCRVPNGGHSAKFQTLPSVGV